MIPYTGSYVLTFQICTISPLPDLDSVYQTIAQNEIIHSTRTPEPAVMIFASQTQPSNHSRPNTTNTKDSSRPGNRDSTRSLQPADALDMKLQDASQLSECFTIIGYPDWWEGRSKSRTNNRNFKPTNNNSTTQT